MSMKLRALGSSWNMTQSGAVLGLREGDRGTPWGGDPRGHVGPTGGALGSW